LEVLSREDILHYLANRQANGFFPDENYSNALHNVFLSVAPKGLDQVSPVIFLNV